MPHHFPSTLSLNVVRSGLATGKSQELAAGSRDLQRRRAQGECRVGSVPSDAGQGPGIPSLSLEAKQKLPRSLRR